MQRRRGTKVKREKIQCHRDRDGSKAFLEVGYHRCRWVESDREAIQTKMKRAIDSGRDSGDGSGGGRWVLPDAEDEVIADEAGAVEGGAITAVGRFDDLHAEHPQAEVTGGEWFAVMPGLINAHHHSGAASHIQHGGPDKLLETWLKALWLIRPTLARLDILLSATRLLQSGVTAVVDLYSPVGDEKAVAADCATALAAYDEIGIRCAFGPGVKDQGHLVVGPRACDEEFLAKLPDGLAARGPGARHVGPRLRDARWLPRHHGRSHRVMVVPRSNRRDLRPRRTALGHRRFLPRDRRGRRTPRRADPTHVSESFYEKLQGPLFAGRAMLLHMQELGLTGPRFSIAHGVWMTDEEIVVMAGTGTAISHNPSSNLRLRAGIAPLNAFLQAGVTTALGMDSTMINDDEDMFAEMRLVRTPTYHEPAPNPPTSCVAPHRVARNRCARKKAWAASRRVTPPPWC